jgi:hypothetical protein
MVFILLLGIGDSFELGTRPYFLCSIKSFWNLKAELKPFLTNKGTSMRTQVFLGDLVMSPLRIRCVFFVG